MRTSAAAVTLLAATAWGADWVYTKTAGTASNAADQEATWPGICRYGKQQSPIDIATVPSSCYESPLPPSCMRCFKHALPPRCMRNARLGRPASRVGVPINVVTRLIHFVDVSIEVDLTGRIPTSCMPLTAVSAP